MTSVHIWRETWGGCVIPTVVCLALTSCSLPLDPDRIIYDTCNADSVASDVSYRPSCTHNNFDGHARRDHIIGRGLKLSMSALEDAGRWSGSNYVVMGEDYELVVLNLQNNGPGGPPVYEFDEEV